MPTPSDPSATPEVAKNTLNIAPENSTFNAIQQYLNTSLCTYGSKIEHPVSDEEKGE